MFKKIFHKTNFFYLYNYSSDKFLLTLGVIIGGLFVIEISNSLVGFVSNFFYLYALIIWVWIRAIEIFSNFLNKRTNNIFFSFSCSWLLPITLICSLGFFHRSIPILYIATIGAIDFILFIFLNLKFRNKKNWLIFGSGFLISLLMLVLISEGNYPWQNIFAYSGIIQADTLRDAANVASWLKYSTISHGVHGLLFEPYHALFVFFIGPFITENFNVFQVFVLTSYILTPALLIYGVYTLIFNISLLKDMKLVLILTLFFIFTVSCFYYVSVQRSVQIATYLYIGIMPLIYGILISPTKNHLSVILLCIFIPIIIFARAYHGILLSIISLYFIFYKKTPNRIIIFFSIMVSVIFVFLYYGQTERSITKLSFIGYFRYFLNPISFANAYLFLILPFIIFFTTRLIDPKFSLFTNTERSRTVLLISIISFVTFILTLRTNPSDTFFQIQPSYWLLFFLLISAPIIKIFWSRQDKNIFHKRPLFIAMVLIFLTTIVANYIQQALTSLTGEAIKNQIKQFRQIVNLRTDGYNNLFLNIKNSEDICKENNKFFLCNIRVKIFGVADLEKIIDNTLQAKMVKTAIILSNGLKGTIGIYVPPEHPFWNIKFKTEVVPSIYFMAVAQIPMLFGAESNYIDDSYSINTVHKNGGTLKNLKSIGGEKNLCNSAKIVGVNNILIFDNMNDQAKILICQ